MSKFRPLFLFLNVVAVFAFGLIAVTAFEAWRRWYGPIARFSLRTALVGVAMCALFVAWIHHRFSGCESQRSVIAQIESEGGTVYHESILSDWLRELFSDDLGRPFDDVLMVNLSFSKVSDDDLKKLAMLHEVRSLSLDSTQITDAGLLHIANLRKLTRVSLDNTATTDRGLEYLQHLMPKLEINTQKLIERRTVARALLETSGMEGFVDVPLSDAIDYLSDLHGITFKWDEVAIEDPKTGGRPIADVKEIPVTIDRRGTLQEVLTDLLQQKGLTFKVVDDGVLITTPER